MENLLRRPSQPAPSNQEKKGAADVADAGAYAAPATSALPAGVEVNVAPESALAQTQAATVAAAATAAPEESSAEDAATVERRSESASSEQKKRGLSARRIWQAAAVALLFVAVGAGVLAFYYSRRASTRDGNSAAQPISISDQQRLVEEKLAEAQDLLAQGKVTEAIARLRYIIGKLDASNPKAHRMLAEALERTGNVSEAIDEYRAAAQLDPRNEETQLRYADALRRVGRTDEAREIYQKLSSSTSGDVVRTAKEQLAALPPAPLQSPNVEQSRENRSAQANRAQEGGANVATSTTTPQPPSSANNSRAGNAANDPVTSYNEAMRIIGGKDIKKMKRAELIYAYQLFQYAQRGPNAADASKHLRELDKVLFEGGKRKQ